MFKNRLEEIAQKKNEVLAKAEADSRALIEKNKQKIDKLILELEEMKLKETKLHEISDKKHDYREIKESLNLEEEIYQGTDEIVVGSDVYIANFGLNGKVIKILKDDKYLVEAGNAQMTVQKSNLKPIKVTNVKIRTFASTNTNFTPKKHVSMFLDLRGERYEDTVK